MKKCRKRILKKGRLKINCNKIMDIAPSVLHKKERTRYTLSASVRFFGDILRI
ncbi:hypothetical protein HMPREF9418_2587 [Neisseria macacae ATCC 33926]|uniref:Uncharacterized protein n=1 Tax=Neisseria macacae ATCC 33926 TaxID=997348 RepID=A0AA36UH11_9NEIS|nr:hypothetical protein HMPREF9418_2587 [Neisseria macacae ATCC 33926]